MKNSFFHKNVFASVAAVALAFGLGASAARGATPSAGAARATAEEAALPPESYTWDFQAEASELLGEIHGLATALHREAGTLQSFARNSKMSRESHVAQLDLMRSHINDAGTRLARLQQIKHVTAPWQQSAISRLHPIAANVAEHTEAAINHVNENPSYLFAPSYQEHLAEAVEQAGALKNTAGNFLAYNNAQQRLDRMQALVELD